MKITIYQKYIALAVLLLGVLFLLGKFYFAWPYWLLWILSINLVTFFFFLVDKLSAGYKDSRIPNMILQLLIIGGGVIGGWMGVLLLRHKSQKLSYYFILIITTIVYGWLVIYFDLFSVFDIDIDL